MDFVAIDFHTVNFSRDSACAFGYAKVENGEVVATVGSLSIRRTPHRSGYLHI